MDRSKWPSVVGRAALLGMALAAAACFGVLLILSPSPALADDSSVGGIGGTYYPLTNTDVRMDSETVQAVVYRSYAEYKVDFLFVNSGKPQTLMLGFPYATDPDDSSRGPIAFRAWQDGKPLAVSVGPGKPESYESYYLHQATFPTGKTTITVQYLADPSATSGSRFPELMPKEFSLPGVQGIDERYDYWLHTGAGWAGTIGKAVVRFTLADDFRGYALDAKSSAASDSGASTSSPETYTKIGGNVYQWVFNDLEPTEKDDVEMAFTNLYFWHETEPMPAVMGPVVTTVAVAGAVTATTLAGGDDPYWPLLDGSPRFALGLTGSHPSVKLGIQGSHAVKEIRIVPGNNETSESFAQNGRPKTVKITLSDGTTSTVKLADQAAVQKFPISGTADWVQLDVIDSYPGSKSADVYLADVSFGSQESPKFASFGSLIAEAGTATQSTVATTPPSTAGAATTVATSPATSVTQTAPATQATQATIPATAGLGDAAATQGKTRVWTVWPIVLFAVAGIAFIAAAVLGAILVSRRRSGGA